MLYFKSCEILVFSLIIIGQTGAHNIVNITCLGVILKKL